MNVGTLTSVPFLMIEFFPYTLRIASTGFIFAAFPAGA